MRLFYKAQLRGLGGWETVVSGSPNYCAGWLGLYLEEPTGHDVRIVPASWPDDMEVDGDAVEVRIRPGRGFVEYPRDD